MPEPSPATANYSRQKIVLIILSLAIGGFGIGTGEFAIMGLMPNVALDFGITEPQVGHLISAYALGVVVGAPVLAIFGAQLFRKHLLIALMAFYALGNFASAMAGSYETLMVSRFVAGLPHGAYFGVAALVAASLVPLNQRAKAVSFIMMGLALALLFGNPLATLLGQHLEWRYAFGFVAVIAAITTVLVFVFLPLNRDEVRHSSLSELRAFNSPKIWYPLAIGAVGFAGMFCVFSYLAPTLLNVTQVEPIWIPVALFVFGLGGFVGNILGGWLFDRFQFRSVGMILLWAAVVLALFPLAAGSLWSILIACFVVALMVAMGPALQTHLMDVAHGAQTLAAASHHAAFNLANAIGPWLGGMAISAGMGWQVTGYVGSATAVAGLIVFFVAQKQLSGERAPSARS
ncbi:MFS transporter [Marinobacter sp. S6332]|uniref:MFS transporter n=1 Tax=Marinobacter sp. S6332 TaxID=2926403 RepID=UPI001FF2E8D7|nr:MFS transporter [Marinobacter sp. S6332]MCK0164192.1 MFS transporter [Marinobacter sp. S6332]